MQQIIQRMMRRLLQRLLQPSNRRAYPLALVMLTSLGLLSACAWESEPRTIVTLVPGGDPIEGQAALVRYGCPACHVIPGIHGEESHVGPPLENFARRNFIGGVAPNTTDNLILWIQSPQAISELSAMPPVGVSEQEARDMAAYLYSLDE